MADVIPQLLSALRTEGEAAADSLSMWGAARGDSCAWAAKPTAAEYEAPLPVWLAGEWRVSSKMGRVQFPLGKRFVGELTPGVRMASILSLPNIGNAPSFNASFLRDVDGSVRPDRAANQRAVLQAFWPDAAVVATEALNGRLLLTYEAPTRRSGRIKQNVDVRLCRSVGALVSDSSWVGADVFTQDNLEQGVRGIYMVVQRYSQVGTRVSLTQRVASFLQPTDPMYFDARGRPVALFDYEYVLTRP